MRYVIVVFGGMIIGVFCGEYIKQIWKSFIFSGLLCAMWALIYIKWIWPI